MNVDTWDNEQKRAARALRRKLERKEDCQELVDAYDKLLRSVWEFITRLLGSAGTRAVLTRSIKLASRKAPLVAKVRVGPSGMELGELRTHVLATGCISAEVMSALVELGVMILTTLSDLAGDALSKPFIRTLETD